jgi:hypothetical protein
MDIPFWPWTIGNQWKQLVSMLDERYGLYAPIESQLRIAFLKTGRHFVTEKACNERWLATRTDECAHYLYLRVPLLIPDRQAFN